MDDLGSERVDLGVRSVQRALDVFEAIAFSGEELGVTQLAERLHVTKGSVHRHLQTLVDRGYLAQNSSTARYLLGAKMRLLARLAPDDDLLQMADGPMRELRDAVGQSVVLSEMTPRGGLVLTTISGVSVIEIGVRPGSELSFHASSQGKVLLAHAPRPIQDRILQAPLTAFTAETIVSRAEMEAELEKVRRSGYASSPNQILFGINALAVPIFNDKDACVASVAVVGSIQHVPAKPDNKMLAPLIETGRRISQALGQGRPAANGTGPDGRAAKRRL